MTRIVITNPEDRTQAVSWYDSGKPEWTAITGLNTDAEARRKVDRMRVYQLLRLWGLAVLTREMPRRS